MFGGLDDAAGDARACAADGLGDVIVGVGVHDQRRSVIVEDCGAVRSAERHERRQKFGPHRAVAMGIDIRQIGVIRSIGVEQTVRAFKHVVVPARVLEACVVITIADFVNMDGVPARRHVVEGQPDQHAGHSLP